MNKFTYKIWYKRASKTADIIINRINQLSNISDEDLLSKSLKLKEIAKEEKYKNNRKLYMRDNLIEAFALASIASQRVLDKMPYKVQLIAGIAIAEGNIAEQKTGEGKTLTALLPSYLYGLMGRGVHVVTVNPYLTERDEAEIGQVHHFLGLSTGVILPDMKNPEKQKSYRADVTYVSNTDLGFDYLRDLLASRKEDLLIPSLSFAIVDEVDSILLDEAKTPLIMSGLPTNKKDPSGLFMMINSAVTKLERGSESSKFSKVDDFYDEERIETGDYIVHDKEKQVILTKDGIKHLEELLHLDNYADSKNDFLQKAVEKSLYAHFVLVKDKDYIVKNNKIELVDEFTGRVLDGRKYSDGLHQAIEAKEKVEITPINETKASITYQNFFRKYDVLSGMTATAFTEKSEFKKTYNLNVIPIKTNKPVVRKDYKDKIFLSRKDKYKAVINKIKKLQNKGQPVLCATTNLNDSELLSHMLTEEGIKHNVLNAKQDLHEAEVIAKAGRHGAITVATNMAGRGTDIKLDDAAAKAGGLYVIGTEKHESERIDNQLRGRSGRQGDVGESVFYISAEDRILKHYGGNRIKSILEQSGFDDGEEIKNKSVAKAMQIGQKKVGLNNYSQRKNTLFFDEIDNTIKNKIYGKRRKILTTDSFEDLKISTKHAIESFFSNKLDIESFNNKKTKALYMFLKENKEPSLVVNYVDNLSESKKEDLRKMLLFTIDYNVKELIGALDFLRSSVNYINLSGIDNKAYYSQEAYKLLDKTINLIYKDFTIMFFEVFYNERG